MLPPELLLFHPMMMLNLLPRIHQKAFQQGGTIAQISKPLSVDPLKSIHESYQLMTETHWSSINQNSQIIINSDKRSIAHNSEISTVYMKLDVYLIIASILVVPHHHHEDPLYTEIRC